MNYKELNCCTLCPRRCGVNRNKGEPGFCKADSRIKIARSALHFWEEPCISGKNGSGTVFFSHCTLKCVYCQNYAISTENHGKYVTEEELCDIFLELQNKGANNINLVTPTHYVPQIITALTLAKEKGLILPIVYNTSGYESVDTLKMLRGYIDVYLPDMKYASDKYSTKYSAARDYFNIAKEAIFEMFSQVGACEFSGSGIIKKGVIVRHLMLPGLLFDSKKIIDYLFSTYKNDIYISIMNQYTPLPTLPLEFCELSEKLPEKYYDTLVDYAANLGIENAFVQEDDASGSEFIPQFYSQDN